ncbi:MAG TPA: DinB family protein [candidate division Zixibacteria bacterium]|nr:DinB family protein [candidate division Zixibacteria bacterium]
MNEEKEIKLNKDSKLSPKISSYYSQMREVRNRLINIINDLPDFVLDYTPDENIVESIGTLLLHIAAVEWSWIFEDIDKKEFKFEEWKYAFPLRQEVKLPQLKGEKKEFYLNKLEKVRLEVYKRLMAFNDDDLDVFIISEGRKYSIEWILFHIIEHESLHIGQILLLKRLSK